MGGSGGCAAVREADVDHSEELPPRRRSARDLVLTGVAVGGDEPRGNVILMPAAGAASRLRASTAGWSMCEATPCATPTGSNEPLYGRTDTKSPMVYSS